MSWAPYALVAMCRRSVLCLAVLLACPAFGQTVSLDRQDDGVLKANLQFGVAINPDDGEGLRSELYFHGGAKHYFGYARLPIFSTYSDIAAAAGLGQGPVVGNLEVGGFYVLETSEIDFVFRLGAVFPTAGTDRETDLATARSTFSRLTDSAADGTEGYGLRLSASPIYNYKWLRVRADMGFDVFIAPSTVDDGPSDTTSVFPYFRFNVAASVKIALMRVGIEFVNIGSLLDALSNPDQAFLHSLTLFVSAHFDPISIDMGYTTPLDDGIRGNVHIVSIGITLTL